jgi:hypothetical protein
MANESESTPSKDNLTNSDKTAPVDCFARELLLEEIKHRRDKEWKIFAWTTSILLAIITAVVAISARPGFANIATPQKIILLVALGVLTVFAALWLYRDFTQEEEVIQRLIEGDYNLKLLVRGKRARLLTGYIAALLLIFATTIGAIFWARGSVPPLPPANSSWYFAVSGDSRDCGDLIMPKIARSIADNRARTPAAFYWHLGDLRAIYRLDCDWATRKDPSSQCGKFRDLTKETNLTPMEVNYLADAWADFKANQVRPFEAADVKVFLGIGNHEIIKPKTRDEFRQQFKELLTSQELQTQRQADRGKGIDSKDGDTYFHFVRKGVDFIYLDNAGVYKDPQSKHADPVFSAEELAWLRQVLSADEADPNVKTIIVGMHEALPDSVSRDHAMDATCPSFCIGNQAYNWLVDSQAKGKHVYVLASHSHYFEQDIYNTPEHEGRVLPGWIIGTAGAEQYKPGIRYGYMLVEVRPDGTIGTSFEEVKRDSPPVLSGEGVASLTNYCFEKNKKSPTPTPTATPRFDCSKCP